MEDNFHFNPADSTLSIGKITAIHIIRGKGLFKKRNSAGKFVYPKGHKRIIYTISGFSLLPEEKDLHLYNEQEKGSKIDPS